MINLLAKDFKLMFGKEKSIAKKIITILITIFFLTCFIGIEVFLFTTILNKIGKFHQAPMAFMNVFLFIFLLLFLESLERLNFFLIKRILNNYPQNQLVIVQLFYLN